MASDRFILFAETLEGFIDYTFKVSEDGEKVHLELTRRLTADIDIASFFEIKPRPGRT